MSAKSTDAAQTNPDQAAATQADASTAAAVEAKAEKKAPARKPRMTAAEAKALGLDPGPYGKG